MTPSTTPEAELTPELIDRVMKLSPEARRQLRRVIIRHLYPDLNPDQFTDSSEIEEYVRTKPSAVVEARN